MRAVDTRFWVDAWVRKLNALDRYVFLYFLTNTHSSWCGVYELDLSMIAFETGIEETQLVKSILPRLVPKIVYIDGWVYVRNFEKYHANRSEKTQKGIESAWRQVPENIRLRIKELGDERYPFEGVSPSTSSSSFTSSSSSTPTETAKPEKTAYGEFNNVLLTDDEYGKLSADIGERNTSVLIAELGSYMASTGKRYKSHYATLQNWARRRIQEAAAKTRAGSQIANIT